jgi:uncharacterized protein (DUF302 family)
MTIAGCEIERTQVLVEHVRLTFEVRFEDFCARLEATLGRFTESVRAEAADEATFRHRIETLSHGRDFLLFDVRDHGALLRLTGRAGNAKQYLVGNPLIALQMTSVDLRAGLYAPLRIFVYEDEGNATRVEYDLPSTLFGQWDAPVMREVGRQLDGKLEKLLCDLAEAEAGAAPGVRAPR